MPCVRTVDDAARIGLTMSGASEHDRQGTQSPGLAVPMKHRFRLLSNATLLAGTLVLASGPGIRPAAAETLFMPTGGSSATVSSPSTTGAAAVPDEPYARLLADLGTSGLLWFEDGRPTPQARAMLHLLEDAAADGLAPADYAAAALARSFDALTGPPGTGPLSDAAGLAALDRRLTRSALRYLRHLHLGRIDPARAHESVSLPPRRFDATALLADALRGESVGTLRERAAPSNVMYARLRGALAHYRDLAASTANLPRIPELPASGKVSPGDHWAGVDALAQWLHALGDLPGLPASADAHYGPELADAVRRFQRRHGLDEDAVIGRQTHAELLVPPARRVAQIELGLERLRWLPEIDASQFVAINIPAFRLWAVSRDGPGAAPDVWETRIVVGNASSGRTPIFIDRMQWIEFNPYWHVPSSITRGELVPKLRARPDYFEQQAMEVLDRSGAPVGPPTPEVIAGLLDGQYRVRQKPGPGNSLGRVKFVLPNRMAIYLHDTPSRGLFARSRRAFSHGCIRVEGPETLAERLLASTGKWPAQSIRNAIDSGNRTIAGLRRPVPVVIFYLTSTVEDDGTVRFYHDIYGYDREALASLRAARQDPSG